MRYIKKSSSVKANFWNAPDLNKLKFNVDAASFKKTNMFSWSGILINHLGKVQATISDVHVEGGDSSILEAKALELAMRWAIDNGVKCVCFELDAQRVVQAMKNSKLIFLSLGLLLIIVNVLLMILYLVHFLLYLEFVTKQHICLLAGFWSLDVV